MRYIIGIDLGTTNCCVSYVDTQDSKLAIQPLRLPQLMAPGHVEAHTTLPSFCYLSTKQEWPSGSLALPWKKSDHCFVGLMAQSHGAKVPTRLVQSAKSWLCHSAAHRKDKILPAEAEADQKISPVEATAYYLKHIKEAWNYLFARSNVEAEFEQQEIVLTVPASFDEVARRLTAEAAKMAGYIHLTLLEEPQAAFYSWISSHENIWKQQLKAGDSILICDIGGGTSDFSLIEVQENSFNRIAVGEHLLLGGDNMDAAIAHYIEEKITKIHGKSDFQTTQWLQLKHQARSAKETLLDHSKTAETFTVLLQGAGSSVIKGSLSAQLQRDEIAHLLLEGFFGQYALDEALQLRRSSGFRTMGLPYEEEPSITKHLAAFLKRSQFNKAPDYVLFNGGAMKPALFQQAIVQSLEKWHPGCRTKILESISLDLAVARGAAYYGKVRRGLGVRIGGGIPKTYYLGIDIKNADGTTSHQALTLLPRGSEEGASYQSSQMFSLRPNIPVSFNLYTSQVRMADRKDDVINIDLKELQPLPAIHTILRMGKKQIADSLSENIPVRLNVALTAIGTLELWLQSQKTEHRWSLEFQLRNASGQENHVSALDSARNDEIFDASYLQPAQQYLRDLFASSSKAEKAMESLEKLLDKPRRDWSLSILRGLFDTLLSLSNSRKINPDMEIRWWNMIGFFLRPGFGYPLDDFRIKELWKIILAEFKSVKSPECQIQQWICYRRIASGLNKGQQTQLANEILTALFPNKTFTIVLKAKSDIYPYSEKMRTLASFELLDVQQKIKIGKALLARILEGKADASDYWSLGRLGARHLLSGSAANVIPSEECSAWAKSLLKLTLNERLAHLFAQLARKTDHREINLSQSIVEEIIAAFANTPHHERLKLLLTETGSLTLSEQEQVFGEKLPAGIVLEQS